VGLVLTAVLAGLAAAGLSFNQAAKSQVLHEIEEGRALFLAEAGVAEAIAMLVTAERTHATPSSTVGSLTNPLAYLSGEAWVDVDDLGGGTFRLTSTGRAGGARRVLEVLVERPAGGLFTNAVFAGNASGDATYAMTFGGSGASADRIEGNVFSGGDIRVEGDAVLSGSVEASGTIAGTPGAEGKKQPIPDIVGMEYETNHDYDVAGLFAAATWQADDAGGSTKKDDYFLEDPYAPLARDAKQDGSDPYLITLTGDSGEGRVFYLDGNLWVHNLKVFSFRFVNESKEPVRVTFIVKGNVYFSDNVFYDDGDRDGLAFIAIEDASEPDSGNVYFGDPEFGTLRHMSAYMYAEHDFVDMNLDATGSKEVELFGIMSAGNRVAIERDYVAEDGTTAHSRLAVTFDGRVASGELELSGLPGWKGGGASWRAVAWRELARP